MLAPSEVGYKGKGSLSLIAGSNSRRLHLARSHAFIPLLPDRAARSCLIDYSFRLPELHHRHRNLPAR